jgi:alkylation response protein AidB-like acyl-CoA dehydrogenase
VTALAWTSGQWMTERAGGSDVSGTATVARADGNAFRLFGTKWFSSATTSEMALTLARIEGVDAAAAADSRLSLFYLETAAPGGGLNGIRLLRLKDKLGTRALPTAELELAGAIAHPVGPPGAGVRTIATMLNITRLYNGVCAASTIRRAVDLARDYAHRRIAFGRPLAAQPLHRATLAGLEAEARAALLLVWRAVELLGRDECGVATVEERAQLRLLTPLVKLFTAKQAVAAASEALECFGGAGYVENTGLPRLLRDAQVLPIWEGTTNVLALDLERVLRGPGEALAALFADLERRLEQAPATLAGERDRVRGALGSLLRQRAAILAAGEDAVQASARAFRAGARSPHRRGPAHRATVLTSSRRRPSRRRPRRPVCGAPPCSSRARRRSPTRSARPRSRLRPVSPSGRTATATNERRQRPGAEHRELGAQRRESHALEHQPAQRVVERGEPAAPGAAAARRRGSARARRRCRMRSTSAWRPGSIHAVHNPRPSAAARR